MPNESADRPMGGTEQETLKRYESVGQDNKRLVIGKNRNGDLVFAVSGARIEYVHLPAEHAAAIVRDVLGFAGVAHHDPEDTPTDRKQRTDQMGDLNVAAFLIAKHIARAEKIAHILAQEAAEGPAREAAARLRNSIAPEDSAKFIDACAELAQLGFTAELVESVAHAMQNHRILAFGWGEVQDLGERGIPGRQGATKGTTSFDWSAT